MLRYTFSIIFILILGSTFAQQSRSSFLLEQPKDYRPSILRLGYDIIPVGEGAFSDRSGQHFQAAIDFYKYFLVAEYGIQQSQRGDNYENNGNYFRMGPEVNILKNSNVNSITFGLRYAHASFEDEIAFVKSTNNFGKVTVNESNLDLRAWWLEMTAGLNVNVWKGFYMGYTVRYKFFRRIKNEGTLVPYDVPGFGLEQNRHGVGFSYFLEWVIPLREQPAPPVNPN